MDGLTTDHYTNEARTEKGKTRACIEARLAPSPLSPVSRSPVREPTSDFTLSFSRTQTSEPTTSSIPNVPGSSPSYQYGFRHPSNTHSWRPQVRPSFSGTVPPNDTHAGPSSQAKLIPRARPGSPIADPRDNKRVKSAPDHQQQDTPPPANATCTYGAQLRAISFDEAVEMADTRSVDDEFLRILPETIPWDKVGSGETQCLGPVGLPSWYCYHENDIKRAAALCGPKEDRSGNERLDWLLLWVNYPFNFTVLGIPGFQVPPCITLAESLYYRETFNLLALTSRTVSPDGVRLLQEVLDRAKASEAGSGLPGADSEDLVKVSGQKWVRNGVQKAQKEAQGTESQEFASSELSVSRRVTRPPPPVRSSPEQPKEMSGVEELVKLRNKITELESKLALHEAQHTQCVHDPHDDLKLAVQKMIDYWDNPPGPNIDLESLEIPSYPDPGPAIVQEENPKSDVLLIEFNRLINRRKVLKEHAKKIDGLLQKIGTPDAHSVILDQGIRDEMGRVLERTNREADLYQELQNQKEQLAQELVTLKESIEGMKEQRKKNKDMKAERVRILKEEMERKIREEMEGEEEEQKEWEWGLQNEREGSDEEQDAL